MVNRIQTLRSSTPLVRPSGRQPGELYVNFPDKQLGVVDTTATPVDLIGVRFFSATTNYVKGDFVVQGGNLYQAAAAVPAGAFNLTQWIQVGGSVIVSDTAPASPPPQAGELWFDSVGGQLYVWYVDPNTSQWVVANTFGGGPYLPLSGGTMTGPLAGTTAAFTGAITTATPTPGDVSTKGATTAFVNTAIASITIPTVQRFAANGTYTPPAGVRYARVRMVAGGGGGGGTFSGTPGGAGGNTTFAGWGVSGGAGGAPGGAGPGGAGGVGGSGGGNGTGTLVVRLNGGYGGNGQSTQQSTLLVYLMGGGGGSTYFGGGGVPNYGPPISTTGGGGSGGLSGAATIGGAGGGGGGEYVEFFVANPVTGPVVIGALGAAGTGNTGSGGANGVAGTSGLVIIEEHYA
ncbi:MAG TPA: hypothetical protein VGF39_16555 [Stellaceae bacterium]